VIDYNLEEIAGAIDHAILNPVATHDDVENGCLTARDAGVAAVCVKPSYVPQAADLLKGSRVAVGTTVGFPHGGNATVIKVREAEQATDDGAVELDMVVNIGNVLAGQWEHVSDDIRAVLDVAHGRGGILKVIFENCYLIEKQKEELCRICADLGVDFAKTSTGFGTGGAAEEDAKLMRRLLPARVKIKAAGGIRNLGDFLKFRRAGADRIGTSSTQEILAECRRRVGPR
jgi:deoxyribose-phosphate aldolase